MSSLVFRPEVEGRAREAWAAEIKVSSQQPPMRYFATDYGSADSAIGKDYG